MNSCFPGARLVLRALAAVFVYITLHEGGHALAAMATGRTVTQITLLSLTPHVSLHGHATAAEEAFAAAAGSGLVVALWFAYSFIRRISAGRMRRDTFLSEAASFFAGIELLAWLVSSAAHTIAPPQNDVTKFIEISGANPVAVFLGVVFTALAAALVYFGGDVTEEVQYIPESRSAVLNS